MLMQTKLSPEHIKIGNCKIVEYECKIKTVAKPNFFTQMNKNEAF